MTAPQIATPIRAESSAKDELARLIQPVRDDFKEFDSRLARRLEGDSPLITSIARHLLKSRGKRIRPALLFLTSRASRQFTPQTIDASLAIELIHTATLLHDDVIDESHMRRNQETVNFKWTNLISVLMGDYLFAKAFKTMVEIGSMELIRVISAATERVSVGELRQIEETRNYDLSENEYLRIIADKTASLFNASCLVGPILTSQTDDARDRFGKFGESVGVSFQIADDLLDFVGDSSVTGKEPGNDLMTGKVTLPLIYALHNGPRDRAEEIRELLDQGVTVGDFPRVMSFVRQSGGVEYAYSRADEICREGMSQVEDLSDSEYFSSLNQIVNFSTRRAS